MQTELWGSQKALTTPADTLYTTSGETLEGDDVLSDLLKLYSVHILK